MLVYFCSTMFSAAPSVRWAPIMYLRIYSFLVCKYLSLRALDKKITTENDFGRTTFLKRFHLSAEVYKKYKNTRLLPILIGLFQKSYNIKLEIWIW